MSSLRQRMTVRDVYAPSLADVRLERRVATTVEVAIADLGQGVADLYVGFQIVLRYRFKLVEVLDFGGG